MQLSGSEQLIETSGHEQPRMSEDSLIDHAKLGCMISVNEILITYRPRIFLFIKKLGITKHHDTEELTQETLIQVQRSICSFEGRSKLSSWIFSIARNIVRNHITRSAQYRYTFTDIDDEQITDDGKKGPLSVVISESSRATLLKNIDSLSETLKQPIVLIGIRGLSYAESAEILKIPVSVLKSRLFRARQTLRELEI